MKAVTDLSQAFALAVPHETGPGHPRRRGVLPGRACRLRQGHATRGRQDPRRISTTPSARSSRGQWPPTRWSTSSRRPA